MIRETPRPQTRLPDFSSVHATQRARPGVQGITAQEPAETQTPEDAAGYPVVPITGSGTKDSFLVQGAPRAPGRVPDFSPANVAVPAAPHATGAMPGGVIVSPTLTARLDSLASKAMPLKAVPITRPSEAPVGQAMVGGAGAHEQAAPMAPVEIEELRLLYEPIWDVKRQAVTAYRMNVTLKVEGALFGLNDFMVTYDDPNLRASLNAVILRKLVSQIQLMRGEHKKAIIVAPLGRRTIEDENGLRFVLDQLSLLSEQERQLVVLEISNAYFGAWPALTPRIAMIHRVCRNVAIRLSLDHKDFQQVAATGANTVTGDLTDHDWPERQAMAALNAFAAGAAVSSLRSAVGGLGTSSTVIAAVCAGLGHLSGKAVGEGTPAPLGVYSLSTEGFYLQRQAQRLQQDQRK